MSKSIFRYAIQTPNRRHSDIWNFFCNKNQQCLYAKRISQKSWMKVTFHKSGHCHLKEYEPGDEIGTPDHKWRYEDAVDGQPVHLMRIVYDLRMQNADLEVDKKIKPMFEHLALPNSFYLDVFFIQSDRDIEISHQQTGVIAAHHMSGGKWVYFSTSFGPLTNGMPDGVAELSIHMGESMKDEVTQEEFLRNMTAVWYRVPQPSGVFVAHEAATAKFSLSTRE
ncbi:hypothetical protein ACN9MB_10005 [Dyella kyungheensis]|uniref:hypothetical protein n=1 Tax=Dyella kyungheensis TaxID=1242174 RepID=UPI003CE8FA55